MQNLRTLSATKLDPSVQSRQELFRLTEQLSSGLPGLQGNALLLMKTGIPTPSAGIVFPPTLQEQISVQFYLDIAPDKNFIRHVRPDAYAKRKSEDPHSDEGGPLYRVWISRLPTPHKHQVISSLGF